MLSNDQSIQSLETAQGSMDYESDNFDRAAYLKIKNELTKRKAAKERMLSQGMPEFKAYLRF